jgi:hypothetical protein
MTSEYLGFTATMGPTKPKVFRLRMTRLPLGSRVGSSDERRDAPMIATDLGAIRGERSRQTISALLGCSWFTVLPQI